MVIDISEKGLSDRAEEKKAARVTLDDINDAIVSEHYFTAGQAVREAPVPESLSLLTFCVLVLKNGFTVTGQSACADPKMYDEGIGRTIARQEAVRQMWALLGYELRSKIALVNEALPKSLPDMQTYVGTKVVHAIPMTRGVYNTFRGWDVPSDEDPADEGYLVEYADGQRSNVEGISGYVSWSPADVFHNAYKKI